MTKGASFDAVMEKRGVVVYYQDDKGKLRKQLYVVVAQDAKPVEANAAAETNVSMTPDETNMQVLAGETLHESWQIVKCHFESTPTGADIDLDGPYVGSTPSAVDVSLGKHVVVMSANGFAPWKREMTVSPQSELTVNAVLQRIR